MNPPENVDDSSPPEDAGRVPLYGTIEVRRKFVQAVKELGLYGTPMWDWDSKLPGNTQKIAELINVPGITSDIVATHLMEPARAPPQAYLWKKDVRLKFIQAVKQLDLETAPISDLRQPGLPQQIVELMNDPEVTSRGVAIHLEQFRNLRINHDQRSKRGITPPEDIWSAQYGYTSMFEVELPEDFRGMFMKLSSASSS